MIRSVAHSQAGQTQQGECKRPPSQMFNLSGGQYIQVGGCLLMASQYPIKRGWFCFEFYKFGPGLSQDLSGQGDLLELGRFCRWSCEGLIQGSLGGCFLPILLCRSDIGFQLANAFCFG